MTVVAFIALGIEVVAAQSFSIDGVGFGGLTVGPTVGSSPGQTVTGTFGGSAVSGPGVAATWGLADRGAVGSQTTASPERHSTSPRIGPTHIPAPSRIP